MFINIQKNLSWAERYKEIKKMNFFYSCSGYTLLWRSDLSINLIGLWRYRCGTVEESNLTST